jgi:hypothetical protein
VTSFRRSRKGVRPEENSGLPRLKSPKSPTRFREEPKLVFEYLARDEKKTAIAGWLSLEPSMNWVIRNYEFETRIVRVSKGKESPYVTHVTGSVHYRDGIEPAQPIDINVERVVDNKRVLKGTYELSKFIVAPTPPVEFTLAAYGLGDFEKPSGRSPNRAAYYAMAIAAVALLISFVLSRIVKRLPERKTEVEPGDLPG